MTTLQTPLTIVANVTTSGTLVAGKHTPCDATSGAQTQTLPTPANIGARLRVEKVDATANAVTVSGTIRGAGSSTIPMTSQYESREFFAESLTSWRPSADHRTTASQDARYATGATVVVAAVDSLAARSAHFRCTGTADQTTIAAAIAALPTSGGRVLLLAGRYSFTDELVIQRSNVTLEGEGFGFWTLFNSGSPGNGTEGVGVTKIKQTVTGKNLIRVDNVTAPEDGVRLHGLTFRNLYLYGFGKTGTGIYCNDSRATDQLIIENVFVHNTSVGMEIFADAPHIRGNTIMDVGGNGLNLNGPSYAYIADNVIADIGGHGINCPAGCADVIITSNTIVRCLKGILITGNAPRNLVVNNKFAANRSDTIEIGTGAHETTVRDNNITSGSTRGLWIHDSDRHNVGGNTIKDCTGGEAIAFNNVNDCAVNGNVISSTSTNQNGLVMNLAVRCSVVGNVFRQVSGTNSTAGFQINANCTGGVAVGNVASGTTAANSISASYTNSANLI